MSTKESDQISAVQIGVNMLHEEALGLVLNGRNNSGYTFNEIIQASMILIAFQWEL